MILLSVPMVLACVGFQPCPAVTRAGVDSPRTASPAAIVSQALSSEERISRTLQSIRIQTIARPLALEPWSVPSASTMSPARRAQPPLRMQRPPTMSKAMAVFAFSVAGLWAGAHAGAALEGDSGGDSPGMRGACIGMQVGGILGGVLGWKLVR
jgi:hypothetical protein